MSNVQRIRPQPGPQEMFLSTPADIAIYGGGAGGGKTWGLLLEPLRHIGNKDFGAVFFRRNTTQIKNEGGLWDESMGLYQPAGGDPKHTLDWRFPSGATISFRHLEYEKTKFDWQGSQIPLICFDELTHFTEGQFWYMVSRNRSMCGVRPYIRATCNPDPDSWVAEFIAWWIDQETGYPIPERAGVIRYFVRIGDTMKWADNPDDLAHYMMPDPESPGNMVPIPVKSATFIPALVTDNKALMRADPGYMANLLAQGTIQRERLLKGNWKIKATDGLFKDHKIRIVDIPPKTFSRVRAWDLAATEQQDDGNLRVAATAGVLMGITSQGQYVIHDVVRDKLGPFEVRELIRRTAQRDGVMVDGSIPQDPGQAGKAQVAELVAMLAGYNYTASPESGDKIVRATPFAAQCEAGNVMLVRGPWNDAFLRELEAFPSSALKDQVDAASRAFNHLIVTPTFRIAL